MDQIKTHFTDNNDLLDTIDRLKESFTVVRCVNYILMECIEFHRDGTYKEVEYHD